MTNRPETLAEVIGLTLEAVDADAALWVECYGVVTTTDPIVRRRERQDRLRALVDSNEVLALYFATLRSLARALPPETPVDDPCCASAGAVIDWCAYALRGIDGARARLRAEVMAERSTNGLAA